MDPFRLTKACMNQTNAPEGNSLAVVARGARANGNPVEDVNKDGVLGKPARMVQIGTRSTGPERMARFLRRETARKGKMCIRDSGYMEDFQAHEPEGAKDRRPTFFALMFVFLAAMFLIVFSNNMLWLFTGWEITTCLLYTSRCV